MTGVSKFSAESAEISALWQVQSQSLAVIDIIYRSIHNLKAGIESERFYFRFIFCIKPSRDYGEFAPLEKKLNFLKKVSKNT